MRGSNHWRPTKSDSSLSGSDGWKINIRFHAVRKGLFRLNPLPTSALKSRGGDHGNQTRPIFDFGWMEIESFHAIRKGLFWFNPLPASALKSRGGVHDIRTRPIFDFGWMEIEGPQAARKGLFWFNPLPASALKSRGGVHAIRTRLLYQTSSFTKMLMRSALSLWPKFPSPFPRG